MPPIAPAPASSARHSGPSCYSWARLASRRRHGMAVKALSAKAGSIHRARASRAVAVWARESPRCRRGITGSRN